MVRAAKQQVPSASLGALPQAQWTAGALTSADGAFKLEVHSKSAKTQVLSQHNPLVGKIPSGSIVALALNGGGATKTLPAATQEQLSVLGQQLGVDLPGLISVLNGPVIAYVRPGIPLPEVTIAARPASPASSASAVGSLLARFASGAKPVATKVDGGTLNRLDLGPVSLYYGVNDGQLVVTDSSNALAELNGSVGRLSGDDVFKEAKDGAGMTDSAQTLHLPRHQGRAAGAVGVRPAREPDSAAGAREQPSPPAVGAALRLERQLGRVVRGLRQDVVALRYPEAPVAARTFQFTSESVTEGHPDKISDQISDAVLDAALANDPESRVACETLITTGLIVVAGELTTSEYIDIPRIARETVRNIGYTRAKYGFDAETCGVILAVDDQSPDIAQGVDTAYELQHDPGDGDPLDQLGAGDQGMMFGYATNETRELMPLPIMLAHRIAKRLSEVRKADVLPYLRPDGKAQVSVRYEVDAEGRQTPVEIERLLVSTQHREGLDAESMIKPDLIEHVLRPILPRELYDERKLDQPGFVYVNPTGKFVIGGPMGDTGLTGRKIIVDTYGGAAPHGGGAFSGKDPTKVDRSAAYAARYVAKNVVAAGLATAARSRWRTRSASRSRSRSWSRRSGRSMCRWGRSNRSCASTSTCAPRRSCATST